MASNLWTITKDHIATGADKPRVGFGSYKGADAAADLPIRFKLYDDDGELYYEGRMATLDCDGDAAFAPLDWATADAGCTEMQVAQPGSDTFETL
jgi:hypothetical protein